MGILSNEEKHKEKHSKEVSLRYRTIIISFLPPHPTYSRTLPNMCVQLYPKMDSTAEARGGMSTHLWSGTSSILTPKEPSCTCADREVFLGRVTSLFQQSSAPSTSFVLGVSSENRASILLCLANTSCPTQGTHLSLTSE